MRILVDNNGNKYWDEADFANDVFAEDAYIFYKKVIIRGLWETREEWDLKDTRTLDNPKGATPAVATPVVETPPAATEVKQEAKKN